MKSRLPDLRVERLRRMPAGDDVWQLAVRTAPEWVASEDGEQDEPYRPLLAVCRSMATGMVGLSHLALPTSPPADMAFEAIASLANTEGIDALPRGLEVADVALRDILGPALEDLGIDVELVDRVDALEDAWVHLRHAIGGAEVERRLYGPDVSIDALRSFAEAALAFERAAPWNHLANDDLVQVETRSAPAGMRWFVVMGAAGMSRGIAFFETRNEFLALMIDPEPATWFTESSHWSFTFDPAPVIPISELERWEEHDLPRAEGGLIPVLVQLSRRGPGQPVGAARLAFAEALLRTLAATSEDEMDEGRWSHTVPTAGGERTIALALPQLIKAESLRAKGRRPSRRPDEMPNRRLMEREMAKVQKLLTEREWENADEVNAFLEANRGKPLPDLWAGEPRGEAQELFYSALEAHGRQRVKLARQALRLWPDCADALVLLAEEMPDHDRSMALYRSAMEAAERTLGPTVFAEQRGHFWGIHETRPYMRARQGLAQLLWNAEEHDAALAHWLEMLELNPGDNQGVRLVVIPRLLERGRDAEAAKVLAAFAEDESAMMKYAFALAAFRQQGKGPESNRHLASALRRNPHAVKYLLEPDNLPLEFPATYAFGSEDEAILLADNMSEAWHATPGAIEWLREQRREAKKARERRRKGSKRGPR